MENPGLIHKCIRPEEAGISSRLWVRFVTAAKREPLVFSHVRRAHEE